MKKLSSFAFAFVIVSAPVAAQNVVAVPSRAAAELQAVQEQQRLKVVRDQVEGQVTDKAKAGIEFEVQQQIALARAGVQSKITKGAPYSADSLTESVQALADGNRIVNRTATRVYRDAEGRTRTERMNASGEVTSINISDPVQGVSYVLNPQTRTAYQSAVIVAVTEGGYVTANVSPSAVATFKATQTENGTAVTVEAQKREQERAAGFAAGAGTAGTGFVRVDGTMLPAKVSAKDANVKKEDLGQQTIAGVAANGSRVTTTIPAGSIGNDQPIEIVSEQWLSPDLQVLVLTKHNDPRTGETTYHLNNIVRAEQARSLFEVPSDYTLQQSFIRKDGVR
jgi:hypothetical protein